MGHGSAIVALKTRIELCLYHRHDPKVTARWITPRPPLPQGYSRSERRGSGTPSRARQPDSVLGIHECKVMHLGRRSKRSRRKVAPAIERIADLPSVLVHADNDLI